MSCHADRWIWDDYTDDGRLLGRGACARVSLGRQKGTNKLVAIRFIAKTNKFYDLQQRVWVSEIACMRALQGHRNMVALYDLYKQDEVRHRSPHAYHAASHSQPVTGHWKHMSATEQACRAKAATRQHACGQWPLSCEAEP